MTKNEKGSVIVLLIAAVLIASTGIFYFSLRTDVVTDAVENETFLNMLFVLENEGQPLATYVLIYYPALRRGAMFDVPGNIGIILKTADRFGRIDSVYETSGIADYCREIENLTGISEIPVTVSMNLAQFSKATDMLGGLPVFISYPIDVEEDGERFLLPSGVVDLDGDKISSYLRYEGDVDMDTSVRNRRETTFLSFLGLLNSKYDMVFNSVFFKMFAKNFTTNLSERNFKQLLMQISEIGSEKIITSEIDGSTREVDGQKMLFPFYEGQVIKDVFQQTTALLSSEDKTVYDRTYALEIQNGTMTQNLAQRTADLLKNFGYDVVSVRNANEANYEKTMIIDHIGNSAVAQALGKIINCDEIQVDDIQSSSETKSYLVDFVIILGKDFDGRRVIKR